MIPVKDNIPTDRVPVVTLLLIAAGVVVHVAAGSGELLQLLVDALFLWIFGANVEDAMSRPRFLALCLLGGAAATGVQVALDPDASAFAGAAAGVAATAVGAHVLLYRGARVVSLVLVPFLFTLVEVPSWILAGAWLALQAAFAATGDPAWATFAAQAAGVALGMAAIRPFAQRRKPVPARLAAIREAAVR